MRVTMQLGLVFLLLMPAAAPAASVPAGMQSLVRIQERNEGSILAMPGVRGIGIGQNKTNQSTELIFHVFVDRSAGNPDLPGALEGVPVKELPAGLIVPQQALMGTSTSNPNGCYAGTTGFKAKVRGSKCQWGYITNNHVAVAGGPNLCPNAAAINTNQFSPGTLDNNCQNGTDIGNLKNFVTIDLAALVDNFVDAAFVANNLSDADNDTSNQIACSIGAPTTNTIPPLTSLGMSVQKCGRTTAYTTGVVTTVNVRFTMGYGANNICGRAVFANQIHIIEPGGASFSQPGDSGSPVVTMQNEPVGLVFAGDGINSYANPIDAVLNGVSADLVAPNEAYPEKDCSGCHQSCSCARAKTGLSQPALQNLSLLSRALKGGNIRKLRQAMIRDQAELIAIAESGDVRYEGVRVALADFKSANFQLVETSFSSPTDPPGAVLTPDNLAALDRLIAELSAVSTSKRMQREMRRIRNGLAQTPMEGRTLREAALLYDAMRVKLSLP